MKPITSPTDCGNGVISFDRVKAAHLPPSSMVGFADCTVPELVKAFNEGQRTPNKLPVIDKTGLTGQYSMLVWQSMEGCTELPGGGGMRCDNIESFADAVKRELGLELVRTTAPYRVLHVTKIEKPAAN